MACSLAVVLLSICFAGTFFASPGAQDDQRPSNGEQDEILQRIESYAGRYMASLPDFICEQITYQSETGKTGKHWHRHDTLTSKLAFSQGREERTLQLVNNKPLVREKVRNDPLITQGEFGSMMQVIFSEDSHAEFAWERWQIVDGSRVAAFTYSIDKEHSKLRLGLTGIVGALVPYRGSILADPQTGGIKRITYVPHDIPPEVETESISTVIDYGPVMIGGQTYLLPSRAVVDMVTPFRRIRNEMQFQDYQKFEAESKVTFGSETEPRPVSPD